MVAIRPDEKWCRAGEAADELLVAGRYADAAAAYASLWDEVRATRKVDALIVSKLVLGMLVCKTMLGALADAHALWTLEMGGKDALGIGIYGLENGQTHERDVAIYLMVSAHLHSFNPDREAAQLGVDKGLSTVVEYATTAEDAAMRDQALGNWYHHLVEIHGSEPSARALASFREAGGDRPEALRPIAYPRPALWVVDWGDDEAFAVMPDGTVASGSNAQVSALEAPTRASSPARPGFWKRLFGR